MRRTSGSAALAVLVAFTAGAWAPAVAQEPCQGPRYRVEIRDESDFALVFHRCDVGRVLAWGRLEPRGRSEASPTLELGRRFVMVVRDLARDSSVRQDFYPLADGGPLVYSLPGQIFSHEPFGGSYTIPGGWASVDGIGPIPDLLRERGVAIPEVSATPIPAAPTPRTTDPTRSAVAPTDGPAAAPTTPTGATSTPGPDAITLLFLGVVAAAIVLMVLRRRGPTRRGE